jgi:hypothetical protein
VGVYSRKSAGVVKGSSGCAEEVIAGCCLLFCHLGHLLCVVFCPSLELLTCQPTLLHITARPHAAEHALNVRRRPGHFNRLRASVNALFLAERATHRHLARDGGAVRRARLRCAYVCALERLDARERDAHPLVGCLQQRFQVLRSLALGVQRREAGAEERGRRVELAYQCRHDEVHRASVCGARAAQFGLRAGPRAVRETRREQAVAPELQELTRGCGCLVRCAQHVGARSPALVLHGCGLTQYLWTATP